ncbi:MAG: AraC family transcriptional regulator, partial [Cyanobacteria bacterium J06636_16]
MKTPPVLNRSNDWLLRGSPSDSRLFHADDADLIWVCSPHVGQGYCQFIPLQDDLTLRIHD